MEMHCTKGNVKGELHSLSEITYDFFLSPITYFYYITLNKTYK